MRDMDLQMLEELDKILPDPEPEPEPEPDVNPLGVNREVTTKRGNKK